MKELLKEIEKLEKQKKELYKISRSALDRNFVIKQINAIDKALEIIKKKI